LLHTETTDPERGSMTRMRPSRDVVAKRLPFRFQATDRIRSLWTSTTRAAWAVLAFHTIHCRPPPCSVTKCFNYLAPLTFAWL